MWLFCFSKNLLEVETTPVFDTLGTVGEVVPSTEGYSVILIENNIDIALAKVISYCFEQIERHDVYANS